ncbi:hypothetical protein GCM10010317_077340 [Streptomyces mirabilis]|uniref:hypothetical protein n=1 Tax=Streptomyces mirabilis TaxID=68239 RepID=UPI00167E4FF5|nr:hypothetical protein [Streptomyces mirabilis]GHD70304.1 hypothetical protein GCM10010317_077340 [Streptomyces mirabilis]
MARVDSPQALAAFMADYRRADGRGDTRRVAELLLDAQAIDADHPGRTGYVDVIRQSHEPDAP